MAKNEAIKKERFEIDGEIFYTCKLVENKNPIVSLMSNSKLRLITFPEIKGLVVAPIKTDSYFKQWVENRK
jgi:hypothetical protein